MRIKVLFAQNEDTDFGPEAMLVVDEYTDDSNPDYFYNEAHKIRAHHAGKAEYAGFSEIWIDLPQGAMEDIQRRCLGKGPEIKGELSN